MSSDQMGNIVSGNLHFDDVYTVFLLFRNHIFRIIVFTARSIDDLIQKIRNDFRIRNINGYSDLRSFSSENSQLCFTAFLEDFNIRILKLYVQLIQRKLNRLVDCFCFFLNKIRHS